MAAEAAMPPVEPAQAEPAAPERPAEAGVACAEDAPTQPKKRKSGILSRAKSSPCLEVMAAKIQRLREEADQAEAAIEGELKKLEELKARIASMRSEAEAKRAAAQRASQEYLKKQCEASISELEACIPKRPLTPYFMFSKDNIVPGLPSSSQSKQISEKWGKLGPEEKQKYIDRHAEETRKFNEWGSSEEGRKNLQQRAELLRQCRTESKEELDKAIAAAASMNAGGALKSTPTKRTKDAENEETPTKDRVAKQRRVAPVRASPPVKEPVLDESVLEKASKANLAEQLRNLAARPEVLALGRSSQELWDALQAHKGMVNAAKHALLST